MGDESKKVISLMGATATGKTDLAVELVGRYPLDIVSVDSALIYREMDIGTAKPDAATLVKAPHRLINILDPAESWSVAEFYDAAMAEISAIHAQGRVPILVGGTMMYFRALQTGLAELPAADEAVRAELDEQARQIGWDGMHAVLAQVDPASAARIHPNDPQRIQRALEVFRLTGQPLSSLLSATAKKAFPYQMLNLVLGPEDRRELDPRIAGRFERMLDAGFVEEVEKLRQRGDLSVDLPSMRAVGYRQVWEFLDGKTTRQEMQEQAIHATEQLAKRQYTWLRSEISRAEESGQACVWLKNTQSEEFVNLLALVDKYMASQGKFC